MFLHTHFLKHFAASEDWLHWMAGSTNCDPATVKQDRKYMEELETVETVEK